MAITNYSTPFTWAQSIAQYSPVSAAALNEFRANANDMVNNLSCITHYSGHYPAYQASYFGGQYTANCGGDCPSHYGNYDVCAADYVTYYSPHYTSHQNSYYFPYNNGYSCK